MDLHHLLGAPVSEWRASARMSNRHRVQAAVSEFLHAWTCGGKADLHLDTSEGGAPSPSLPTLAIQVLSSFPPLLQLLQSYATMEEQTKRAIDSVHCASAHQAAQRVAEQASFCFSGFYVALFQQLYLLPLSPWYLLCPVPQPFLLFLLLQ